jgi:hypothetical protein
MLLKLFFLSILLLCTIVISYQDFKNREISVWVILLFTALCVLQTFMFQGALALFYHFISALIYLLICLCVLFLFFYLKEKKFPKLIDKKIGLADLILIVAIGSTMEITVLILFLTLSFIFFALIGFTFLRKYETLPLAGMLIIVFFIFQVFASFTELSFQHFISAFFT